MSAEIALLNSLLQGPLWSATNLWPLTLDARLCDLRPRFLSKGRVGRGYRAIARNGRVLLASDGTLVELADRPARIRVQTWHKPILPGDRPEAYGILLGVRALDDAVELDIYTARLASPSQEPCDLALEVGGGLRLEFRREA
jgi:hypothetical protein